MASEAPEKKSEEEQYVCSLCRATVVPVVIETDRGPRYKCPECGKLMHPTPIGEVPPGEVLKPAEIEMTESIVEELAGKLHTVYGISKQKALAIIDTVKGNPAIALNPMNLFMHISQLEPRVNAYHLWTVLSGIFQRLKSVGWAGMIPAFQTLQQQMYQQQPLMYGWQQPYQQPPFAFGYDQSGYRPESRMSPTPMKTVIEGQEIQTDMAGYMAWRRWESEKKKDEQEAREHGLRMRKLESEIKEIESKATGVGRVEEKVEVEIEGKKFSVPVSLAPAYLALSKPKESEELKELRKELASEREERHKTELGHMESRIDQLERQPSFIDQLEAWEHGAERMGFKRGGRTAIDVVETGIEKVTTGMDRLGERAEKILAGGKEFRPEITRAPSEREKKAGEIEKRLEKGEEILAAEDRLLKAASKLGK